MKKPEKIYHTKFTSIKELKEEKEEEKKQKKEFLKLYRQKFTTKVSSNINRERKRKRERKKKTSNRFKKIFLTQKKIKGLFYINENLHFCYFFSSKIYIIYLK